MRYSNSQYWDFCAPIAGILLTLSFAPFDYSYSALIALVFLFACWQNVSAKRAALRGYLFGLGAFGSGVSWVYISMHDFGGAGVPGSTILTGLFCAFWALFPALAGYLSLKMVSINKGRAQLLLFPVIWILVEYFRGYWILNGFPWLHIGFSQLETPLSGYIAIFGVYGTGFIAALTASVIGEIVRSDKKRLLITALIILWGTGALLRNQTWTHEIGRPIRVSMIQGNIAQDQKWRPENKINTLLKYKKMTEEHWDANIIIWPETAIPAYLDQVKDAFLTPLANDAKLHNTDLIISVPVQERDPNKNFNAVITLGKEQGMYRKSHLLPFGEYLPLQPLSGFVLNLLNIRLGNFTPGAVDQPLMKAGGYPFITLVCYEDAFGDLSIQGLADAAFLVNVTNDGWFGNSIEPHQHMQMARMRAIETGRFLLRSTNTGITAIVSPKGEITGEAPLFEETALTGTITPMGGMTPYAIWGDKPVILGMVVLLLGLMGYGRFFKIKRLA
ncbi:MAG: apolipoprotein N-acyltransferase [Methylobacter sp.]|nr:MAG: apolipoprotein N-acyltransferase [Methylobacter sp.]